MYIFDNKFTLESREGLEKYFKGYNYEASAMSFSGLNMWREINNFCYQEIGDYLCVAGMDNLEEGIDRHFLMMPLTKDNNYDSKSLRTTLLEAKAIFSAKGETFYLMLVPETMTKLVDEAFGEELPWEYDRDNSDYVYKKDDLINLSGRAFHKKKNHLNYFLKTYENWKYLPLTNDMADLANEFIFEFNVRKNLSDPHERQLLAYEEKAMRDVFSQVEDIGLYAGAIMIDGKVEALSLGGRLNGDTAVCHVEKANINFRGLYQLINREWCRNLPADVSMVNREEDMGLPNLRKAKLSYQPDHLVNKYRVII